MAQHPKDLEDRTADFAQAVRLFVRTLPRTIGNIEDVRQLVRSSGSVAANCIEANQSLGPKDRLLRFRTCRKEAKESQLWLRLLNTGGNGPTEERRSILWQEAHELKLIFSAILKRLERREGA